MIQNRNLEQLAFNLTQSHQLQEPNEKEILAQASHYLLNDSKEETKFNFNDQNQIIRQMRLQIIKILEYKISKVFFNNQGILDNFRNKSNIFQQQLELFFLLLNGIKGSVIQYQQLISFIEQFCQINITKDQINQIVEMWQFERFSKLQIELIYSKYNIKQLSNIPSIINIIGIIVYNLKNLNQFDFYYFLLIILIQQEILKTQIQLNVEFQKAKQILNKIEIIIINQITNYNLHQNLNDFLQSQNLELKDILKQQQVIDFCIARHFTNWLLKISDDGSKPPNSEINIFIDIRDQSQIGKLNFMLDNFKGLMKQLKEKYEYSNNYETRLIKMVKASAFVDNFEQVAGNALTVLSYLQSVIQNQDFQNINIKNCSLNNIQFFSCNFNQSKINNVSIVLAQFIECQIQNVFWQNLESSRLYTSRKNTRSIFSAHNSILIEMKRNKIQSFQNISFLNLLTGKQINFSRYKISQDRNKSKINLKLSYKGQIILLANEPTICFWNIQTKKFVRVLKNQPHFKLSHDCQTIAHVTDKQIKIWKTVDKVCNLKIQPTETSNLIGKVKFTKDDKILIFKEAKSISLWRLSDGEEIFQIFQRVRELEDVILSPNGDLLFWKNDLKLTLWNVKEQKILRTFEYQDLINCKFSPNGQILIYWTYNYLFYWNIKTEQLIQKQFYQFYEKCVVLSDDHKCKNITFLDSETIVLPCENRIIFFKLDSAKQLYSLEENPQKQQKISISFDKSKLISYGLQGNFDFVNLWNLKIFQKYVSNEQSLISINPKFLSFVTNESVCVIDDCKTIQIRALNDLRIIQELNFDDCKLYSLIISPNFKKLAYSLETKIIIQKIENGEIVQTQKFDVNQKNIYLMRFSPNGEYLAGYLQNFQTFLILWELQNFTKIYLCQIQMFDEKIFPLEFSQDSLNFSVGLDGQVQIISLNNQKSKVLGESLQNKNIQDLSQSRLVGSSTQTSTFSPDGQLIAAGELEIKVWRIYDKQQIQILKGHKKKITKIAFLVNNMTIISASYDQSVRVWNILSGFQLQVLKFHKSKIIQLSISPEGKTMITGDIDGLIYLWSHKNNPKDFSQLQENINFYAEKSCQFSLCKIIGNPRFRARNCSVEGSKFISTEGFNLSSIFKENYQVSTRFI